jgi:hypothetical protein
MILLILLVLTNLLWLLMVVKLIKHKNTGTSNIMYVRCSCSHLASKHNMSGCYVAGCACYLSRRKVHAHGLFDADLYTAQMETFGNTEELRALMGSATIGTTRTPIQPSEVIVNRILAGQ